MAKRPKKTEEPTSETKEKAEEKPYKVGRGKPPREHSFKKGQVANPRGAGAHNPAMRELKNLTRSELVQVGNMIIKGTHRELKALVKNEDATVLQRMLASVAKRVVDTGDNGPLETLLNRFIGKVKDEVEMTGTGVLSAAPQIIVTLPDNGRSKAS